MSEASIPIIDVAKQSGGSLVLNPHVAALPPYNAGLTVAVARAASGRSDIARLASNENPDGCSPAVLEALRSSQFEPWRYADPACTELRTALAEKLAAAPECIVVGNGSEEMIAAIARAALMPGCEVVTVTPSFGLHEIEPLAAGARVTKVPMGADLGFDIAAIAAALAAEPRILFLSSPSNPVGPALDHAQLERLARAASPRTLFVLDEAYFEYADEGAPDARDILGAAGLPHVVLRTFSKAYGLAGLRVGYAVCSDAGLARAVAAAKTPFNVNGAAQIAAMAALRDEAWMKASTARLRAERERVRAALHRLGLRPAPSQTNFLFLDIGADSDGIAAALLREGIIVKPWREAGYRSYLRLTIGHAADNDRLLAGLAACLGTDGPPAFNESENRSGNTEGNRNDQPRISR
ncbi:MAG TPA: aminotransferase class I/II-fold pyridoxal phosphate-dependent enzyme [Bosea sp. (in: a-proteobacteria)]|jgi:histidinol-phosphate aminotransferase|nr:aminotransferase class I/II-fold pyridoxal phosphate-dependent enzyme [Bosea sp. (in: a-proteobacteria)]